MKPFTKKNIVLTLAIVSAFGVCSVGVGATFAAFSITTEINQNVFVQGSHLIYLDPNMWETEGEEVFFVHVWNDARSQTNWFEASKDPTDTYWTFDFDTSTYNNLLFARVNPAHSNTPQWSEVWNQSVDLTVPENRNVLYTISGWHISNENQKSPGSWSACPF